MVELEQEVFLLLILLYIYIYNTAGSNNNTNYLRIATVAPSSSILEDTKEKGYV